MNEVKRTVLAALVLAFVAGVGAGAWVGELRAAAGERDDVSVDVRLRAYDEKYDLTPSEERRVRDVLLRYDAKRTEILSELDAERWQRLQLALEKARADLAEILDERDTPGPANGG